MIAKPQRETQIISLVWQSLNTYTPIKKHFFTIWLRVTFRPLGKGLGLDFLKTGGYFQSIIQLSSCPIHLKQNQGNIVQCIASALEYTAYSPSLDSALGHLQVVQAGVHVGD